MPASERFCLPLAFQQGFRHEACGEHQAEKFEIVGLRADAAEAQADAVNGVEQEAPKRADYQKVSFKEKLPAFYHRFRPLRRVPGTWSS